VSDELTHLSERAELHASLDRALDDSEAGRGMDAAEYLAQYRARREDRERSSSEARRTRGPTL
jgi:hypothetical protein